MLRTAPWQWVLAALVVIGTGLFVRFDGLGEPSLWYDEVLHFNLALEAAEEPPSAWITGRVGDRENGPLYYATQLLALRLTSGEAAVRLIPAISGTATILVMVGLGLAALKSPLVALVAAILLATSPLHVYFSREGRPYAAIMLMAGLFLLLLLMRDRKWAIALAYLLAIATAGIGAAGAPVMISFGMLSALDWAIWERPRVSPTLHFAFAALLGGALLIAPTIERFKAAKPHPEMDVTYPLSLTAADRLVASLTVSGVDWASTRPLSLVLVVLAICGALSLALRSRRLALHITGMLILPVVCWLVLLVSLDRWYVVRYTSAGLPAFILLVAIGTVSPIMSLWKRLAGAAVQRTCSWIPLLGVFSLTLALSVPNWQAVRTESWQKPDWRGVTDLISSLSLDNEPVVAQNKFSATCIRYYLDRSGTQIEVLTVRSDPEKALRIAEENKRAWVLSSGYLKAEAFRTWMTTLDPILRSHLSNLELYYYPSFAAFLQTPERALALERFLDPESSSGDRQGFGESELLLGTGWSFPETSIDGTQFRWAVAEIVEFGLLSQIPQAPILWLRLLPFPAANEPPQTVEVFLNGQLATQLHLHPGWNDYAVPIPVEHWQVGVNMVTLHFGWLQSPTDLNPDSPDSRQLAAAFDFAELTTSGVFPTP